MNCAVLEEKIKAADPLRFAAGLRDRAQNGQVLMLGAMEDEVIPKRCTEKLADALAIPDKIIWIDGLGHYTSMAELPFALKTTGDFFAHDLPPGVVPPSDASRTSEMRKLADIMRQAATLLAQKPAEQATFRGSAVFGIAGRAAVPRRPAKNPSRFGTSFRVFVQSAHRRRNIARARRISLDCQRRSRPGRDREPRAVFSRILGRRSSPQNISN